MHIESEIDPKRQCACGRHLPKRRRFCDDCRELHKRKAKSAFEQRHPGRSHHASGLPPKAPQSLQEAGR